MIWRFLPLKFGPKQVRNASGNETSYARNFTLGHKIAPYNLKNSFPLIHFRNFEWLVFVIRIHHQQNNHKLTHLRIVFTSAISSASRAAISFIFPDISILSRSYLKTLRREISYCSVHNIWITVNVWISVQLNLLKTKRNLLYISNQSVPRCKHFPPRLFKDQT
jgi:hypothetical protein